MKPYNVAPYSTDTYDGHTGIVYRNGSSFGGSVTLQAFIQSANYKIFSNGQSCYLLAGNILSGLTTDSLSGLDTGTTHLVFARTSSDTLSGIDNATSIATRPTIPVPIPPTFILGERGDLIYARAVRPFPPTSTADSATTPHNGKVIYNYNGLGGGSGGLAGVNSPWANFGGAILIGSVQSGVGVNCGPPSTGVPSVGGVGNAAKMTIEAKVQVTSLALMEQPSVICGWYDSSGAPIPLTLVCYADGTGGVLWVDSNAAQQVIQETHKVFSDFNKHDIAAVYDGTTMRLFIDGVQQNSQATPGLTAPTTQNFWIGNGDPIFEVLNNSYVDEVRWSNTNRYTSGGYTPSSSPFTADANTLALYHLDDLRW